MRRSISGTFNPPPIGGFVVPDATDPIRTILTQNQSIAPGAATARTVGSAVLTTPSLEGPQGNQKWSILSISFLSYLVLNDQSGNLTPASVNQPTFGKLGQIRAGLILDDQNTSTGGVIANLVGAVGTGLLSYPADQSLVTTLWDPANDELPPQDVTFDKNFNQNAKVITGTLVPPVPVELTAGILSPTLGLWMLPSLLGNAVTATQSGSLTPGHYAVGLMLCNSQYAINYDDGM